MNSSPLFPSQFTYALPSTISTAEIRFPSSFSPSRLNSTVVLGVTRNALPSSNSISARPFSPVRNCVPCVMGRFAKAFSNPNPAFLSICTAPCTSLKRTMRACDSAAAGSARSAPAKAVHTIEQICRLHIGLCIRNPFDFLPRLQHVPLLRIVKSFTLNPPPLINALPWRHCPFLSTPSPAPPPH